MGQKVNPHGFRVGVIADWDSKWFADKDYQKNLLEDIKIRDFIKDKQFQAGISRVTIERTEQKMRISIYTAKPGIVIGRQGSMESEMFREGTVTDEDGNTISAVDQDCTILRIIDLHDFGIRHEESFVIGKNMQTEK